MNDTLRRDDMKPYDPNTAAFYALSPETQAVLKRAATYRRGARLTAAQIEEIDRDWIMVPRRAGFAQVAIDREKLRAFYL